MPLDGARRHIATGSQSPAIPLITNNPVFQVGIIPLDGRMEQKPNQKDDTAQQLSIKIGDTIRGEEVSQTRKKGAAVIGKVLQVQLEDGAVSAYKIITQRGKEVFVDPSTSTKIKLHGDFVLPTVPNTNGAMEHRVVLFEEWKLIQKSSR